MAQNLESIVSDKHLDEIYLKIWEVGHNITNTRWTNTTFFLTMSFAIFGFSFHADNARASFAMLLIERLAAVGIYWFAFFLFLRFNDYTRFIRDYLGELEQNTGLRLQSGAESLMRKRNWRSSTRLLR